jgi:hypothetical protein
MQDKIIEKILDRYYANKLSKEIIDSFIFIYGVDFRIKRCEDRIEICVKKCKYKETEYKAIIHFRLDEAIIHLMRIDETRKYVRELIEEYIEKN